MPYIFPGHRYFIARAGVVQLPAIHQLQVFIDAKYKSNLYNKFDTSEILKEDHRHDLHQIMAYSSFSKTGFKYGVLCYPSDKLEVKQKKFKNGINEVTNTIFMLGIPLKKGSLNEAKKLLMVELNDIEKKFSFNSAMSSSS